MPKLEVHLEEMHKNIWIKAVNVVGGLGGTAFGQYQFVARTRQHGSSEAPPVVASAAFPLLHFVDPETVEEPAADSDAASRLAALHQELVAAGWRRQETSGRHWWSRIYERDE